MAVKTRGYYGPSIQATRLSPADGPPHRLALIEYRVWKGWPEDIDVPLAPVWARAVVWPMGMRSWMEEWVAP